MANLPPSLPIKRAAFALVVWLVFAAPGFLHAQDGVIDLAALPNYANQPRPFYIGRDNTPVFPGAVPAPFAPNIMTNKGATLGRLLFYDKRLSRNNTISCSSCHQQAHAFGDPATASVGVGGTTARHAMRLVNARFGEFEFFWDKRAPFLEQLATQPIRSPIEMGFSGTNGDPTFEDLLAKLSALPEYQLLFNAAFGSPGIDELRIQKALSQFIRSIQSFDTKYDSAVAGGGSFTGFFQSFTESENRGLRLFVRSDSDGGANCSKCHFEPGFSTLSLGNNGVITAIGGGTDLTVRKAPDLRNLVNPSGQLNAPLMHNGAFTSLAQVIDHYNAIPGDNPDLSPILRRPGGAVQNLNLTQQERLDIEAFLLTLSGTAIYADPKWSNPFRADGTITIVDTTLPPSQTVNLSTRMQVLTGDRVGIGGFIITGTAPKRFLVRALGPSLAQFGMSNLLADPTITLNGPAGFVPVVNDDWKSSQQTEIEGAGLAPGNDRESAIVATLAPGNYTAVLSGANGGIGNGILEIYDLDFAADSQLGNISTRALVGTGDNILIAGFTIGNAIGVDSIIVRGLGPSLAGSSLGQLLLDPTLEVRNANGTALIANDNWGQSAAASEIQAAGLAPSFASESAVALTLGPGAYTALLSGAPTSPSPSGIGLVEVYSLGRLP